ncbi:MAG: O-antigen ligase family protein [Candidatus Moranbacteria bacterium]|nr:O-antigen ligase family protein [Candidatus Moranbacteria bacterium]MDD3964623.1 O-antigen ligase family protein [Candidatus Moranbacteria bacterium]
MLKKLTFFFLFFLPFQFALHPTDGIDLPIIRIFATILFLFWCVQGLVKKHISLPSPSTLFFFLAFLFWAIASIFWAEKSEWAIRKILFLLSFFPLFLVFADLLQEKVFREKAARYIAFGVLLSASLSLILFCMQFVFGVEKVFAFLVKSVLPFFLGPNFGAVVAEYPSLLVNISGRTVLRATGFFPDPHMFSFFLGMSLFLILFVAEKSVGKIRHLFVLGAIIVLIADLLTFSRGGYIGLIVGLSAFSFPFLFRYIKKRKSFFFASSIVLLFGTIVLLSPIGTRLFSSFSQTDASNKERLRLWEMTADFVGEHPLLGSGLGNYPLTVKPTATYREPIYAHNTYLDVAGELGLPGLFFFEGLLFLGIVSAWRRWYKKGETLFLAVFSSLLLFSSHAIFETPLFSVHILPLLLFFLALGVYSKEKTQEST